MQHSSRLLWWRICTPLDCIDFKQSLTGSRGQEEGIRRRKGRERRSGNSRSGFTSLSSLGRKQMRDLRGLCTGAVSPLGAG